MVFQLEDYYKVDRLLTGLTAQPKGTTAQWYLNKTSLLTDPNHLSSLALCLEEDSGTFMGSDGTKTPPSAFFEARTCIGSFFQLPKTSFPSQNFVE